MKIFAPFIWLGRKINSMLDASIKELEDESVEDRSKGAW